MSEFDVDAYTSEIEAEFLRPFQLCHSESGDDKDDDNDMVYHGTTTKKRDIMKERNALPIHMTTNLVMSTPPIGI
jgi:hypothetical protein